MAASRDDTGAVSRSWSEKAASSLVVPVYLLGRRRKKKAMQTMLAIAVAAGARGLCTCALLRRYITSVTGASRTC